MPPNFRELGRSSALAARTSKVDSNDRTILKFDTKLANFLRMLIENIFSTSQPYNLCYALQWKSCKNAPPAIAGVCRQPSKAYLNYSYVNVLLAGRNFIVSRLATLVVPSEFSSVVLPIFGSTTDKFRQLYPLRLVKIKILPGIINPAKDFCYRDLNVRPCVCPS